MHKHKKWYYVIAEALDYEDILFSRLSLKSKIKNILKFVVYNKVKVVMVLVQLTYHINTVWVLNQDYDKDDV